MLIFYGLVRLLSLDFLLRRSELAPQASWDRMIQRARSATGENAYRMECVEMMTKAKSLAGR